MHSLSMKKGPSGSMAWHSLAAVMLWTKIAQSRGMTWRSVHVSGHIGCALNAFGGIKRIRNALQIMIKKYD